MENEKKNIFEKLYNINLSSKVKEKIGLSYLSWADAWSELKKVYPDATWNIYHRTIHTEEVKTIKDTDGTETVIKTSYDNEVPYFTDGRTAFVKVGVIVEGVEEIEELPVMDNRNNAVQLSMVSSTLVNKAIQRAFVKACARHGLGLYIYSGEDLPEADRKVIDFKAIGDNCDRFKTVTLNQEGFDKMKQDVITGVQDKYPDDAAKALTEYVVKVANGKRLSMFDLEHDSQNLQRIYNFINELKKQLAAPNGK